MLDPRRHYASLRLVALLPLLLFLPAVIAFFMDPDVVWGEYLGVFFHLSILFLVSRLEAAPWAKAAGYGWVALDVLAGVWIVASSLVNRSWPVRMIGVITGVWLAGYSFAGTLLAEEFLRPAGIMILAWFASLAIFHRDNPGHAATPPSPAPA
jgi:hypothetical protein